MALKKSSEVAKDSCCPKCRYAVMECGVNAVTGNLAVGLAAGLATGGLLGPARKTIKCGGCGAGSAGEHRFQICPESMRIAGISAAGQSACVTRSPRSKGRTHETSLPAGLPAGASRCHPWGRCSGGSTSVR